MYASQYVNQTATLAPGLFTSSPAEKRKPAGQSKQAKSAGEYRRSIVYGSFLCSQSVYLDTQGPPIEKAECSRINTYFRSCKPEDTRNNHTSRKLARGIHNVPESSQPERWLKLKFTLALDIQPRYPGTRTKRRAFALNVVLTAQTYACSVLFSLVQG